MSKLLQINASIFTADGQSSQLAREFVEQWQQAHPASEVVVRDLAQEPVPHLSGERFQAFLSAAGERSPEQQAVVDYSDTLIREVTEADVIVLGLPMYNFGIPSTLKAWIDHIARAGVTFKYTEQGPVGLLQNKKVYVLATRGGMYAGTPKDSQTQFVKDFFAFIGLNDVEFVYVEGLAMGGDSQQAALTEARARIGQLAA